MGVQAWVWDVRTFSQRKISEESKPHRNTRKGPRDTEKERETSERNMLEPELGV